MYIENCYLYDGDQAFVMWNYIVLTWQNMSDEESFHEESSDSVNDDDEESNNHEDDDEDTNAIPAITHSMVFKCNGTLKEHEYQETLALVQKKMREGNSCTS